MTEGLHPIRKGAMLRLTSGSENVEELLTVNRRLHDIDAGRYEYELCCPSKTGYYQYNQDDVEDLFVDTGLTNEMAKPIMDPEIREMYQGMCDHSWHETAPGGFLCSHCRMSVLYPEDDECSECGGGERTVLLPPDDGSSSLVCQRHGVLTEVDV